MDDRCCDAPVLTEQGDCLSCGAYVASADERLHADCRRRYRTLGPSRSWDAWHADSRNCRPVVGRGSDAEQLAYAPWSQ